jgi:hypothetical protein
MKMPPLEQQQIDIMERFNFERVLIAMHALNWTWLGEPVTLEKLKQTANRLMADVQKEYNQENGWRSVATGGFEARIDPICDQQRLSLSFHVESVDAPMGEY